MVVWLISLSGLSKFNNYLALSIQATKSELLKILERQRYYSWTLAINISKP